MATETQTAPKAAPKLSTYVVTADAITVTIGRKPNGRAQYTRVLRGATVKGRDDAPTIQQFLTLGAIEKVTSAEHLRELQTDLKNLEVAPNGVPFSRHRLTVRKASSLSGAPDDPVAPIIEEITPLPAGVQSSSDAILAE